MAEGLRPQTVPRRPALCNGPAAEIFEMTEVMPASGLEQMLTDIADRLGRQEEYTRRIEASLFALARLPDDPLTTTDFTIENVDETPRPRHTPTDIRWPNRRPAPEPVRSLAEDD